MAEDKEQKRLLLREQRVANMKKAREARIANIAARKVAALESHGGERKPARNPYLNAPIERVQKDAEHGVDAATAASIIKPVAPVAEADVAEATMSKPEQVVPLSAGGHQHFLFNMFHFFRFRTKQYEGEKVEKVGGRKWWMVGLGALPILLGLGAFVLFGTSRNSVAGFVGVVGMVSGGMLVYFGLQSQQSGIKIIRPGQKIVKNANAMNIYARESKAGVLADWIEFDEMKPSECFGQPRKCLNDNHLYYVHIWDKEKAALKEFTLPDTAYRDPRTFCLNLTIPCHRKLAAHKADLFQKIAPFAIVAAMGIIGFLMVATSAPPKAG